MRDYRCPLGAILPTKMDTEQVKRDGWRDKRILVVSADDERLDWMDREFVKQLGEKLYGKKQP